ncbi:MAG: DNA polymerase III subunit gamma/tau [Lachnospiraceae bacterium]|nr:DNA polymerase III subunit gamma/tau [Candidatus Colinaster scatohippi]
MSYVALYRKFRPNNFADVKGQDHIVTTLKNQITSDRLGHAYLFCGTRGTGKTTVAKILAKAVNCENPVDGNPCGECNCCKSIAAGANMSVVEMDAASNNSVDDVREIIDTVSFPPADAKYRVYIVDEVHMMTNNACNALLKTLEEPPSYCIFILATTDPQKLPITILSRCQRYDFRRISIDTIADRLEELTSIEDVNIEPRAIRYIAKAADGSMRDALSLLDQCIAFNYGVTLTYDNVLNVLGAVDTSVFSRLFRAIIKQQVVECMQVLEDAVMSGRELTQFVYDFTWYLRNILIAKTSEKADEILDISTEAKASLMEESEMVESSVLLRYIRVMSALSNEIRYSPQKRVQIEMALIKLCRPQMETDNESLLDRIRVLEEKLEQGIPMIPSDGYQVRTSVTNEQPIKKVELPKALPEDIEIIVRNWGKLVNDAEALIKTHLKGAYPSITEDGKLKIMLPNKIAKEHFETETNSQMIQNALSEYVEKDVVYVLDYIGEEEEKRAMNPNLCDIPGISMEIVTEAGSGDSEFN